VLGRHGQVGPGVPSGLARPCYEGLGSCRSHGTSGGPHGSTNLIVPDRAGLYHAWAEPG
jgi:hypothetical protein